MKNNFVGEIPTGGYVGHSHSTGIFIGDSNSGGGCFAHSHSLGILIGESHSGGGYFGQIPTGG